MEAIQRTLDSAAGSILSDQNYEQSFAFYRFWFDMGRTIYQIPSDQVFNDIWNNRTTNSMIVHEKGQLIHSTGHLTLRFASDAESDRILAAPNDSGLRGRLCTKCLQEFVSYNLTLVEQTVGNQAPGQGAKNLFYADANFIAHWANLGYVEEATIRNHILQSLISHPKLYDHQADALIILFKLAGATFGAYADPSVVDRCFELLKGHSYTPPWPSNYPAHHNYLRVRTESVQVRAPRPGGER